MPLIPNQALLHYKITEQIGEGGMGVVWRATDTTLQRDVAIKVLPDGVANSPERLARFEREAKVLASLNHPNIAAIHGLHETDGNHFLVLELIEGEDLAERMRRDAIPIPEAVALAIQIATALEAAHENQVVHRDLKPANVKLAGGKPGSLSPGTVKVLDFGLAKVWAPDSTDSSLSFSPTITANMTQAGVILGTAAYMSPEQARGQDVDKRSDVWSFGVLLYEMLTGVQMFAGETATDILGAIVHRTPDWGLLPKNTPPALVRLLKRCLTQELSERLRDIGEARYALTHLEEDNAPAPTGAPATRPSTTWPWKAAAAVFLLLSGILIAVLATRSTPRAVLRATIEPPPGHVLLADAERGGQVRISPDGRALTFVAEDEDGISQVWVRSLDSTEARSLPGTEGGSRPFWSHDSRSIAFFAEGNLRRVSLEGAGVLTVADARDGRGGDWGADGTIVFAPGPGEALLRVPASGGQAVEATTLSVGEGVRETSHREPRFLPDGHHFLYLVQGGNDESDWTIRVGNVEDSGPGPVVGTTTSGVAYSEGYLLTLQGTTLVAQEFDPDSFSLSGEPVPVAEDIILDTNFGIGVFATGPGGLLAYQSGEGVETRFTWMSEQDGIVQTVGPTENYNQFDLSPDRTRVAVTIQESDGIRDVWIIDLERSTRTRLTFSSTEKKGMHGEPIWSPDGKWIAYISNHEGTWDIYRKPVDGLGEEEVVLADESNDLWVYDWSPDGKYVVYGQEVPEHNSAEDLIALPVSGDGDSIRITNTPFSEWPAAFSPDGRWVAYTSPESGRREVYVVPFPGIDGRWQVSTEGGHYPHWSPDGSRVYYWNRRSLMVATVQASGSTLQIGDAREVLKVPHRAGWASFGINAEGDEYLVLAGDASLAQAPISLFVNWQEELKRR